MIAESVLEPAGAQAIRIHGHWLLYFYVTLAVYLIMSAIFIYVLIGRARRRVSPTEPPGGEDPPERTRRFATVVSGAGVLTAAILIALLVSSAVTGRDLFGYRNKPDLQINITGQQWWWYVEYPNDDPSRTLVTANEIHIPTHTRVGLNLRSAEVIHSFWVPNLNGKRDLIPGRANMMVIEADTPGIYRGQCAEYCGLQHAHMMLRVIAEPADKFQAWLDHQLQNAPEPTDALHQHGHDVFLNAPCILCHTIRGTGAYGRVGPDLTHIASRTTIAAGSFPNTPGHLAGWITDSQSLKPGNHMPPIALRPDDLQDLLTYLEDLK